jgi:DNA-directed RNA polymerase specialized sigma24 family protein
VLLRRGAPSSTVDDALQIAAERALRRREPFDSLQGWTNWTIKVAWHEVQAEWRRQARVVPGDPPERPELADTAAIVESRVELSEVAEALFGLNPRDQEAILAELREDRDSTAEPLSPSEKMRRYRARRRLVGLIADDWSLLGRGNAGVQ